MSAVPLQTAGRGSGAMSVVVTAIMVALALIALAATAALRHVEIEWRDALSGRWTMELISTDPDHPVTAADVELVLAKLRTTPGVSAAAVVPPEDIKRLLGAALGDAASDVSLPTLIDIRFKPAAPPNQSALLSGVAFASASARLDDHADWTGDLTRFAKTGEALGFAMFAVIALATALTIAATAQSRLAANLDEIDLLHVLGASDHFVVRQFLRAAIRPAALGAAAGTLAASAAIFAFLAMARSVAPLLPELTLSWADLAALAAVPIGAVLLTLAVVRGTTLALVSRLP